MAESDWRKQLVKAGVVKTYEEFLAEFQIDELLGTLFESPVMQKIKDTLSAADEE